MKPSQPTPHPCGIARRRRRAAHGAAHRARCAVVIVVRPHPSEPRTLQFSANVGAVFPEPDGAAPPPRADDGAVVLYALHWAVCAGGPGGTAQNWHNALVAVSETDAIVLPFDGALRERMQSLSDGQWVTILGQSERRRRVHVATHLEDGYCAWLWLHVALSKGRNIGAFMRSDPASQDGASLFELQIVDAFTAGPGRSSADRPAARMWKAYQGSWNFLRSEARRMPPYRSVGPTT